MKLGGGSLLLIAISGATFKRESEAVSERWQNWEASFTEEAPQASGLHPGVHQPAGISFSATCVNKPEHNTLHLTLRTPADGVGAWGHTSAGPGVSDLWVKGVHVQEVSGPRHRDSSSTSLATAFGFSPNILSSAARTPATGRSSQRVLGASAPNFGSPIA